MPGDTPAETVAAIGWDGIECPVRAKGQVLPERVEEDLPKFVEALRKRGKAIHIITTDVKNVAQPLTQKVLHTAAKLGITEETDCLALIVSEETGTISIAAEGQRVLEEQVKQQVAELQRLARLKRYLSPQVAETHSPQPSPPRRPRRPGKDRWCDCSSSDSRRVPA